jgi:hypothetical protein
MASGGAWSLLQAAAKFHQFGKNIEYAAEGILSEWAVKVRDAAKESIGTYKYKWPELSESVIARHGDTPLLDTGELRDSIGAVVQMYSRESGRAVVGSDSEKAVWQELGTSKIPPRSFLLESALLKKADIGKILHKYIRSAWVSAGRDNEILHLLHAIKLGLEIARDIVRVGKKFGR